MMLRFPGRLLPRRYEETSNKHRSMPIMISIITEKSTRVEISDHINNRLVRWRQAPHQVFRQVISFDRRAMFSHRWHLSLVAIEGVVRRHAMSQRKPQTIAQPVLLGDGKIGNGEEIIGPRHHAGQHDEHDIAQPMATSPLDPRIGQIRKDIDQSVWHRRDRVQEPTPGGRIESLSRLPPAPHQPIPRTAEICETLRFPSI